MQKTSDIVLNIFGGNVIERLHVISLAYLNVLSSLIWRMPLVFGH